MNIVTILEFVLLAAVWGAAFLFMRIATPNLGVILLIQLRVLFAGLALLPLAIKWQKLGEIRHKSKSLLIVGIINSAIPFSLFAFASLYLPTGFSAILNGTTPLFGTMISFFYLQKNLSWSRFIGLIMGFVGVIILVGLSNIPLDWFFLLALIAGLIGALMYAVGAIYIKQKLAKVSPITIAVGSQFSAAIFLLPVTPFYLPEKFPSLEIMTVVIAFSLLSTALAYILYFDLINKLGASKALTVAYLIPLFAMIYGAIILNEPITISMIIGCCLILSGTAIALSNR